MKSEIIAVGSELLTPFRQDTNSLYLTEKLNEIGVGVAFKTIVGDRRRDLVSAVRTALGRADIVAVMGGLGPTEDDLSREAVAEALGVGIRRDGQLVVALAARFAKRRIPMTDNNLKQADIIEGATVLPNANGTAPGLWLDTSFNGHRKLVMLVPGPPKECKALFADQCIPRLREILPVRHIAKRVLKATMIPESTADALLAPIYSTYKDVDTTILAGNAEIQLQLFCAKPSLELAQHRVDELASKLEEALEEHLFSSTGETLEQIVVYYLELKQETLAVAESCTGGLLSQRITSISGSSRSFLGGAVVYSNELKADFASVPPQLIANHGAVSAEVAEAMAQGIRRRVGASMGVGITGIAGPGGGTPEKPVGLVYVAVSYANKTESLECNFSGDRDRIRLWASQQALDMIRRRLM
ncbi:competence/damage-inducible protein A [Acidicapsa acidisoli]|uniref:competence/damage-inducible protein A n=1 Tax=Acidicapsa acidisoli TaxID=1615681 RepID=UPI0021DF692C|nr:competence/damage-inducible protein A [Acidicapsa acidisoli]